MQLSLVVLLKLNEVIKCILMNTTNLFKMSRNILWIMLCMLTLSIRKAKIMIKKIFIGFRPSFGHNMQLLSLRRSKQPRSAHSCVLFNFVQGGLMLWFLKWKLFIKQINKWNNLKEEACFFSSPIWTASHLNF